MDISEIRKSSEVSYTNEYDKGAYGIGKLTGVKLKNSSRISYEYDKFGKLVKESAFLKKDSSSLNTAFSYDESGRIANITYPSGEILSHIYDQDTGVIKGLSGLLNLKVDYDELLKVSNQDSWFDDKKKVLSQDSTTMSEWITVRAERIILQSGGYLQSFLQII